MSRRAAVFVIIAIFTLLPGAAIAAAGGRPVLVAIYHGQRIPLSDVGAHHCHNALRTRILCFDSTAARDGSFQQTASGRYTALVANATSTVDYVTFFADINFGGASFTTASAIDNLGSIGWNDRISSFQSLNSGHPKWFRDANYLGTAWQWIAGSWVGNVGSAANDQFSSVEDVP